MLTVELEPFDTEEVWTEPPLPPVVSIFLGTVTTALLGVLLCCWLGYL